MRLSDNQPTSHRDADEDGNTIRLPLVGSIAAGHERFMEEDIEEYIETPKSKLSPADPEKYFYLRVTGDSMTGAYIKDGDIVLIRRSSNPKNGAHVAAMTDGSTATLKTLVVHKDHVELKPEKLEYPSYEVSITDFKDGTASILGEVVEVIKR